MIHEKIIGILQKYIKGFVIHANQSQGCSRCIDFTDGQTFRANLNDAGDACECLPFEPDDITALSRSSADVIVDTVFDISAPANTACKCWTGKYTSTSTGTLMCLECATYAGFIDDPSHLTDCLSATTQCEPRGFSTVVESISWDHYNPSVRCGCDTSKNFVDNIGAQTDLEGCYCNAYDNWWTLRSGEYQETTQYESDIDYTDIS